MDTFFVKLPQCSGKNCFLLSQLRDEGREGIDITLTDGENFWKGTLTEEDMDALCSNLKMDFNTYVQETVKAFTRKHMGDLNFDYQLKQQAGGVLDFLWKKEAGDKEIKIVMGSVTLHKEKSAASALTLLFTGCISMTTALQQKIHSLETDNQRLGQERQNALKRLEKCVAAKDELEQDLYSKFVAVLNSKKEKIRQLQDGADGESVDVDPTPVPSTSSTQPANGRKGRGKNTKRSPSPPPQEDSDDSKGDEFDRDTDEETPPKKRAVASRTADIEANESLALGDDDDDDDKNKGVVRRPARQRGGNKRQTPAKPVLPKVSSASKSVESGSSSARTPRRGSMRKSGSGNSQRSADFDADDLLKDF